MLHQIVKLGVYVPEVIQAVSKMLILTKNRNLVGCVSDEARDQEHSKCGKTNNPAT